MKRVRYLAGVVGIAPIAAGALLAGAAPATAQAVSHGKTVSLHAAAGHQARILPDISWSLFCNNNPLKVYNSGGNKTCYVNGGYTDFSSGAFPNFSKIYTGNNEAFAVVAENGHRYYCYDSNKNTNYPATGCKSPQGGHANDHGNLIWLSIY
jgi:hypothetical protein